MATKTVDIKCVIGREAVIGYSGENNVQRMLFPIGSWLQKWPEAEPRMLYKRPGEFFPTPIDAKMIDDTTIAWEITRYDVEYQGTGTMWIAFVNDADDVVDMTPETPIRVLKGPTTIPVNTPEAVLPGWIKKVYDLLDEIPGRTEEAIQAALETGRFKGEKGDPGPMGLTGPRGMAGPPGQDGVTPRVEMERFEATFGSGLEVTVYGDNSAETKQVMDGHSPTVTLSRTPAGVQITAKNKDDTQSVTVYDGTPGTGIIDIRLTEV